MEKKDTEDLLGIFEALLSAQLRAVRQLQSGALERKPLAANVCHTWKSL